MDLRTSRKKEFKTCSFFKKRRRLCFRRGGAATHGLPATAPVNNFRRCVLERKERKREERKEKREKSFLKMGKKPAPSPYIEAGPVRFFFPWTKPVRFSFFGPLDSPLAHFFFFSLFLLFRFLLSPPFFPYCTLFFFFFYAPYLFYVLHFIFLYLFYAPYLFIVLHFMHFYFLFSIFALMNLQLLVYYFLSFILLPIRMYLGPM